MATICIQRLISRGINRLQLDNRSGLVRWMIPIKNTCRSSAAEWQWQLDNDFSGEKNAVLMRRAGRRVYLADGPSVVSCCAPSFFKKTQQIITENRLDYIQRKATDWESSSECVCVPYEDFEPILIFGKCIPTKTGMGAKKKYLSTWLFRITISWNLLLINWMLRSFHCTALVLGCILSLSLKGMKGINCEHSLSRLYARIGWAWGKLLRRCTTMLNKATTPPATVRKHDLNCAELEKANEETVPLLII